MNCVKMTMSTKTNWCQPTTRELEACHTTKDPGDYAPGAPGQHKDDGCCRGVVVRSPRLRIVNGYITGNVPVFTEATGARSFDSQVTPAVHDCVSSAVDSFLAWAVPVGVSARCHCCMTFHRLCFLVFF